MKLEEEIKIDVEEIRTAIENGIFFIKNTQLPSGEIPTYISSDEDMKNCRYIKTISMALLVASSLKYVKEFSFEASIIISKSLDFLIDEMENDIKWKFFGKDSNVIPDLEDTSYALALFLENNIFLDYKKIAEEILEYRTEKGIFHTWFTKIDTKIDWVTNTNILYFYNNSIMKRIPEVEEYLKYVIKNGQFKNGSLYYKNAFSFIYFFTRLSSDDKMKIFNNEISILVDFLLERFSFDGCWNNSFNNILATTALINSGYNGPILKFGITKILAEQDTDGGWPIGQIFNHRSINYVYGSRELSTSIAIEGLAKYTCMHQDSKDMKIQ
jgi:hypothetical protein